NPQGASGGGCAGHISRQVGEAGCQVGRREMGAMTGGSVVIDRPVEQVWAWLNDEQHELIWRRPYLKELRRTGPYAVGTRFEGVNSGGGKLDRFVDEVTEYRAPVRIAWRQVTD